MHHIAVANDGHALVTSDIDGSGALDMYLYSLTARTFTNIRHSTGSTANPNGRSIGAIERGMPTASGDGSRIVIVPEEGIRRPLVLQYSPGNGRLMETSLNFSHNANHYRPALDRNGSRIIVSNDEATSVYAADYTLFCELPATARAYAVSHVGNRAFTVNNANVLQAFRLDTNGGPCLQDGSDIPLTFDPGIDPSGFGFPSSNVRMTLTTPDNATLFMAGVNGILVKPWP